MFFLVCCICELFLWWFDVVGILWVEVFVGGGILVVGVVVSVGLVVLVLFYCSVLVGVVDVGECLGLFKLLLV